MSSVDRKNLPVWVLIEEEKVPQMGKFVDALLLGHGIANIYIYKKDGSVVICTAMIEGNEEHHLNNFTRH